uniref:Uncharacterized protein n=1 Tax=Tetranychus urticae TaxID=32264 RepID=T1KDV2_TETUR
MVHQLDRLPVKSIHQSRNPFLRKGNPIQILKSYKWLCHVKNLPKNNVYPNLDASFAFMNAAPGLLFNLVQKTLTIFQYRLKKL